MCQSSNMYSIYVILIAHDHKTNFMRFSFISVELIKHLSRLNRFKLAHKCFFFFFCNKLYCEKKQPLTLLQTHNHAQFRTIIKLILKKNENIFDGMFGWWTWTICDFNVSFSLCKIMYNAFKKIPCKLKIYFLWKLYVVYFIV